MNTIKIIGIYAIKNKLNSKVYIGSSINTYKRWAKEHHPALNSNNHYNTHLQHAWNKYGQENFEFEVLEECDKDRLSAREEYWIEHYKSWNRDFGYNLVRIVNGRKVLSEETIKRKSEAAKKYPEEIYRSIVDLFKDGVSKNSISKQLKIPRMVVYNHLEIAGLYENQHGNKKKLTDAVKSLISGLRDEGMSWLEISEQLKISLTQINRMKLKRDGKFCTDKINRSSYRTLTPEVKIKVEEARRLGKSWKDIASELGVSRQVFYRHGMDKLLSGLKGPRNKITQEIKNDIDALLKNGHSIRQISDLTNIAQSTIRLTISKMGL